MVLDKEGTRLYTIPINEENREKLMQMSEKQQGTGVPQVGKFKKKPGLSQDKTELEYYDFPHQKYIKKNY